MNDADDPFSKKPDLDSLEKHIQLDGRYDGTPTPPPVVEKSAESPRKLGPIAQFYRDLIDCLTEPRFFFEQRYPQVSLTYALTFGIIVAWIAAFLDWLTRLVRHESMFDGLLKLKEKLQGIPIWKTLPDNFWAQQQPDHVSAVPHWLMELVGIALSPFQSLLGFCVSGIILFIGAYLLVPKTVEIDKDPVDITHLIKIVCFTSAPHLIASILGFLPLGMGAFIGWIYGVIILTLGLSQRYKISNLRALGVMLIPTFIAMFILSCFIGLGIALVFGLFSAFFGAH